MPGCRYRLRWARGCARAEATFDDVPGLHAALDTIVCESVAGGRPIEVDLYTLPTRDDPLLLQFLIGHPRIATLLWHTDGECEIASEPGVRGDSAPADDTLTGFTTLASDGPAVLSPAALRAALEIYVLTGQRASGLQWATMAAD